MGNTLKVGDLVTTDDTSHGPIGVIIELTNRLYSPDLYIPSVKVLVEGETVEYDTEELWKFYETR